MLKRTLATALALLMAVLTLAGSSLAEAEAAYTTPDVLMFARTGYFGDVSDFPELKQEFMDYFKETYGFELQVTAIARTDYMQKVELMIAGGELQGFVNVFGTSDVLNAIMNGTIEPLDAYLENNEVWNALPDEIKNIYKIDGQTWAIPASYIPRTFTRTIRKDWLDNLGLEVPKTIEDLYEVAKAFTENDPDGNGENDTFGITAAGCWNLQDIFQSFGARLGTDGSNSIAWYPETNTYEDSMLKPEMVDALEYLRDMYANGYLDLEWATNTGALMRERIWNGQAGSAYYWDMFGTNDSYNTIVKSNPDVEFVEIVGLAGKSDTNLNYIMGGASPVVMVTGTPQPQEQIDAYLNIFLGTGEGNLMGRYGIEGKHFVMDGNTVIRQIDPSTEAVYTQPTILSEYPQYNYDVYPVLIDGTEEEMEASRKVQVDRLANLQAATDAGVAYQHPYQDFFSDTFTLAKADINNLFKETMAKIVSGQVSIEDGIASYQSQMKALGGDAIIAELTEYYDLNASSTAY